MHWRVAVIRAGSLAVIEVVSSASVFVSPSVVGADLLDLDVVVVCVGTTSAPVLWILRNLPT